MTCIFDTSNIEIQDRAESVFYSSSDLIIYRDANRLVVADCDQNIIGTIQCSVDYLRYEFLELPEQIIFLFRGSDLVVVDKARRTSHHSSLDPLRVGVVVSKIFGGQADSIIFATKQSDRIQFTNYDYVQGQRLNQTSSWNVSNATDLYVSGGLILYSCLDYSTIVACNMNTGETLWNRFEAAQVNQGLYEYDGDLIYSCPGLMKKGAGSQVETFRAPLLSVSSIECIDQHSLIVTSNNKCNLASYHLPTKSIQWEILGRHPILESIVAKSVDGSTLLFCRTAEYIGIVNVTSGKSESSIRTPNGARLRQTGDHIVIQKSTGTSTILMAGEASDI